MHTHTYLLERREHQTDIDWQRDHNRVKGTDLQGQLIEDSGPELDVSVAV